jgi:thioredoxin 1
MVGVSPALPAALEAKMLEFTNDNFVSETKEGLVLVDFWAPWCGPCRMVGPVIEQLSKEYAGKVKVGKLNVDEHQQPAIAYHVRSIPTVILFKDGKPLETIVGASPKGAYERAIGKHLPAPN